MKTPPSVEIYRELISRGYNIINSRMSGVRSVEISYKAGDMHNGGSGYGAVKHTWESHETYDIEEIVEELDKKIKEFYLKDSMDEALD